MSSWHSRARNCAPLISRKGFGSTITMMWRLPICFSMALWMARAGAGPVSGAVELSNSQDPSVHRNKNYSGVFIGLEPVDHPVAAPPVPKHERILQRDKRFVPHVIAVPV